MSPDEHIKSAIRTFITTELRPGTSITDDDSLLEKGILDSMAMTSLLEFIKQRFGVEVPLDMKEDPDHFESLNVIARMVGTLRSAA